MNVAWNWCDEVAMREVWFRIPNSREGGRVLFRDSAPKKQLISRSFAKEDVIIIERSILDIFPLPFHIHTQSSPQKKIPNTIQIPFSSSINTPPSYHQIRFETIGLQSETDYIFTLLEQPENIIEKKKRRKFSTRYISYHFPILARTRIRSSNTR